MIPVLNCSGRLVDLSSPQVMGILNITPDSFSDGGRFSTLDNALKQAEEMVQAGAMLIDVGGESTRPGAQVVGVSEELDRVIPVIEAIRSSIPVAISVDTSKAEVMREAVQAGAGMINDVRALQAPAALQVAAELDVPVCLMHMQGQPGSMQQSPHYEDVVFDVRQCLLDRADACLAAGIDKNQIVLDPGFGFGKTLDHNLALLHGLDRLVETGFPILAGMSRKSMIGAVLGDVPVDQRVHGSVAAAVIAAMKGARILRVHDVDETVQALKVVTALDGRLQSKQQTQ